MTTGGVTTLVLLVNPRVTETTERLNFVKRDRTSGDTNHDKVLILKFKMSSEKGGEIKCDKFIKSTPRVKNIDLPFRKRKDWKKKKRDL